MSKFPKNKQKCLNKVKKGLGLGLRYGYQLFPMPRVVTARTAVYLRNPNIQFQH